MDQFEDDDTFSNRVYRITTSSNQEGSGLYLCRFDIDYLFNNDDSIKDDQKDNVDGSDLKKKRVLKMEDMAKDDSVLYLLMIARDSSHCIFLTIT